MPGILSWNFREGDRSEYLAHYLLSALGVSVPVPRQEDIGADFHCTLARRDGGRLTFLEPFLVQVKSASKARAISYGGLTEDNGQWKKEELDWLYAQEVPLLIGVVDKKAFRLDLFSISNVWFGWYAAGVPGEVVLAPNDPLEQGAEVPRPRPEPVAEWPAGVGDGRRWRVPLGPPLVSLTAESIDDEVELNNFRRILGWAIRVEQQNIVYRRLGVHFSRWPLHIKTNEAKTVTYGLGLVGNPAPGANTEAQLRAIAPILGALAANYRAQQKSAEFAQIKTLCLLLDLAWQETQELRDLVPGLIA